MHVTLPPTHSLIYRFERFSFSFAFVRLCLSQTGVCVLLLRRSHPNSNPKPDREVVCTQRTRPAHPTNCQH
jgi:hypothetical protein